MCKIGSGDVSRNSKRVHHFQIEVLVFNSFLLLYENKKGIQHLIHPSSKAECCKLAAKYTDT